MLSLLLGYLRLVALRKESVDRNSMFVAVAPARTPVALRKESVDRNRSQAAKKGRCKDVALRKESVDRNNDKEQEPQLDGSLSARRAWIEITIKSKNRNLTVSLSARRAWIEISAHTEALKKTSGRSPQGERG